MITIARNESKPKKTVVLMYGWLGSSVHNVKKYADLYVEKGCEDVVFGTASPSAVMLQAEKN